MSLCQKKKKGSNWQQKKKKYLQMFRQNNGTEGVLKKEDVSCLQEQLRSKVTRDQALGFA